MKLSTAHKIGRFFQYFVLILVGVIMIYPLVWMVGATFKSNAEIFSGIGFLTANPTLQGYIDAVTQNYGGDISIWRAFINTYSFVIPKVIFTVISSVIAAYGFSRFKFKGRDLLFGIMISWSMGVNSTAALAADHNDMPRVFAKRWAKNDMPVGAAVTSGVVASCVCVLGVLIEMASPDSSLFWSFFALNLVMLLLSYLPVFPAFLKLRREDAKTPRPFRVPGSDTALKWIAYVPMVLIVISIIFTAIPLSFDAETLASFLPITIGSILSVAIGEVLIALRGKNARS